MNPETSEPASRLPGALQTLFSVNLALIGFGAGLLNGLLSVGGGIFIVPGLIFLRKVNVRVAVATSLGTVFLLSLVALAGHLVISGFSLSVGGSLALIAAGMVGAQAGAWLLMRLPQRYVFFAFSAFTLFSATHLISLALGFAAPIGEGQPPLWSYPVIGFISGVFSGLLGLGGGGIAVLGFSIAFHTPVLSGLPVALALNVTNSLAGVLAQWRKALVRWGDVFRMVPAALAGIALGVALAVSLPADALRVVFALFFVVMGFRMFRKGLREN